jgi:hypothetical protein
MDATGQPGVHVLVKVCCDQVDYCKLRIACADQIKFSRDWKALSKIVSILLSAALIAKLTGQ